MPRISPDGQEMAFSFQGDIWIYNFDTQQSKRLTIHEGYESNPIWNSSGDQLAFSSNRKGAVTIVGPASKVKPSCLNTDALPPG